MAHEIRIHLELLCNTDDGDAPRAAVIEKTVGLIDARPDRTIALS